MHSLFFLNVRLFNVIIIILLWGWGCVCVCVCVIIIAKNGGRNGITLEQIF